MQNAMALGTQRDTVGDIKAEFGMVCPVEDMVGMNCTRDATLLADISIANEYGGAPHDKLRCKPSTLTLHRAPILVGIARSVPTCAGSGAEDLATLVGQERLAAHWTGSGFWRIAHRPTCFRAILGGGGAISFHAERLATAGAGQRDLSILHGHILTQHANECKYVTLQRLADMGLEPRLVETGT